MAVKPQSVMSKGSFNVSVAMKLLLIERVRVQRFARASVVR
jgi:hypothetical protein